MTPIVPLADLVTELRAMHSIPCLTAADFLDALPELPPCPTCGGSGDLLDLICDNCGASASLPLGMTCSNHLAKPSPCPDCVDGHVTWQRCVNVFNELHHMMVLAKIDRAVGLGAAQYRGAAEVIRYLRAVR